MNKFFSILSLSVVVFLALFIGDKTWDYVSQYLRDKADIRLQEELDSIGMEEDVSIPALISPNPRTLPEMTTNVQVTEDVDTPKFSMLNHKQGDQHPPLRLTFKNFKKEHRCMAMNIYHEARSEPILGQEAVAWVTLNRMTHKNWRSTVCGVVWQSKQFSWTHDGKSDSTGEKKAYRIAEKIARDIMLNYYVYDDPTHNANHYHANYVKPLWARKMTKTIVIDNHLFYLAVY